ATYTIADTEVAGVNAREHNFADAGFGNAVRGRDNMFDGVTAAVAARQRDGAERTRVVTAILNLQERTRAVVQGERRVEGIGGGDVRREDLRLWLAHKSVEQLHEAEFFRRPENGVDTGNLCNFLRLQLRVAADNRHVRVGGNAPRLTHDLAAFAVGMVGDRARVDDKYVRRLGKFHFPVALLLEHPRNRGGLGEIQLATERIEGDFFHYGAKVGFFRVRWKDGSGRQWRLGLARRAK